nr:hypothetical protein GCM10020185_46320 [Pseudomonas brassicacearum subsp. brassicacearum]
MAVKAVKTDVYTWEGKDRKGTKMSGELTGQSPALVKAQLRKQGINPQKVRKKSTSIFSKGKRIKPLDIALFTRQMATMLKAGVPLLQAFDIIGEGFDNPNMRKLVDEVKQEVAAGNSFAAALRKCPQYFDELYCNLVDAGEQAGALDTLLDRVATYKEKERSAQGQDQESHDLSSGSGPRRRSGHGDPAGQGRAAIRIGILRVWRETASLHSDGHRPVGNHAAMVVGDAWRGGGGLFLA